MVKKRNFLKNKDKGFFQDLLLRIKLILRLIGDRRINVLLKILPVIGLIYLISPIDLIPEIALPVVGYLDDALVIWLCTTLFVELCPDQVVQEHMNALQKVVNATWMDVPQQDESGYDLEADQHETPGKN
jgi:uncharacterized membrane protein YkvA (DUF1232 family)